MILLPEKKAEIINGLLPLLGETTHTHEKQMQASGRYLINNGVSLDVEGNLLKPDTEYVYCEVTTEPVDHEKRISDVIDRAETMEGMMEDLSRYLVKYGKDKQTITDSIENHNG